MPVLVPIPRQRLALALLLATACAASCAVFPDEAVLPAVGNTDLGGGRGNEIAGATGQAGSAVASGGAGASSVVGGGGGGGGADGGNGGAVEPGGGAAGDGGAGGTGIATCDEPQQLVVRASEDAWIDAAQEDANHGADAQLLVSGGAAERRTLLKVVIPAAPAGVWLVKATLDFNLESNQDVMLAERALGLYRLSRDYVEGKVTWVNFTNGAKNVWDAPGGDFGGILARATLPAETATGSLSFDVTEPLSSVYSAQAVPLALIVREVGAPPSAPAALAFTSSEVNASVPALTIEYCEP